MNFFLSLSSEPMIRLYQAAARIRPSPVLAVRHAGTASVLSVPISLGQPYLGPDRTPALLMEKGLTKMLADCGWRVSLIPEILSNTAPAKDDAALNAKNCDLVGKICERIYNVTHEQAKTSNFLLILGGDHCIPIGTIPGIVAARPSTGVVWVDAHADINTPSSSSSGNMHGMPLGFLLGLVDKPNALPSMQWFKPCLQPKDIVYIGLRDLDTPEKNTIKRLGIKAFTMYDVDLLGIGKVMEQTCDYLSKHKSLHLSYDIDALDPFFAPSTGTAVRGGLTFREGNFICEYLAASGKLSSMELVEVNPSLHSDLDSKQTLEMALTLIGSSMGQTIL